ncbi:MAG: hypothetical protein ACI81L_002030 [Verrucomicrobiales bacterium]|jgi:hypothetical protein
MSFLRRRGALVGLLGSIIVVFVGLVATVAFSFIDDAPASAQTNELPPEVPRRNLPKVLDGTVFDSARVGDIIVVGGDFTQLEKQDGERIDVSGAYAYHVDTGELIDSFVPVLTKNEGDPVILAVESAGPDSVLLGGKFGSVNGHNHRRLSKISISSGQVDTSFASDFDGPVRDIVLKNGRLFVGGEFTSVNGVARGRLV